MLTKTTTFEFRSVESEKAEAMRRYNNQRYFRHTIRACAAALLFYLWFPTVAVTLLAVCDWFYRTGAVIVTNRTVVFVSANLLVALVFLLSRDRRDEDLYDQYTSSSVIVTAADEKVADASSSAVIVTAADEKVADDDDSKNQTVAVLVEEVVAEKPTVAAALIEEVVVAEKQIVPAIIEEEKVDVEAVTTELKRTYRRTRSERKKKVNRPATAAFRRTESANSAIERLSSEEFRMKVEAFIMEKKRCLVKEKNDVVEWQKHSSYGLELVGADVSSYGSY